MDHLGRHRPPGCAEIVRHPAILLRESYRVDGKVKKRTLLNLTTSLIGRSTARPHHLIEGFRALLKGGTALPPGHVSAVLGTLRKIGLDRL